MKPVYQTIFSEPNGNCVQAAIASILELKLEDVPNFMEYPGNKWWAALCDFLATLGLQPIGIDTKKMDKDWKPIGWHLLDGTSPRGDFNHVLVGYQGKPIHDPNPVGHCELKDLEHYIVFISSLGAPP